MSRWPLLDRTLASLLVFCRKCARKLVELLAETCLGTPFGEFREVGEGSLEAGHPPEQRREVVDCTAFFVPFIGFELPVLPVPVVE